MPGPLIKYAAAAAAALMAAAVFAGAAAAQTVTVSGARTQTQSIADGATLYITAAGSVIPAAGAAVTNAATGNAALQNAGRLQNPRNSQHVIHLRGNGNRVDNLAGGVISTAAQFSDMVLFAGNNNRFTNHTAATVTSSGAIGQRGIYFNGDGNAAFNYGRIDPPGRHGFVFTGANNAAHNYAHIKTAGLDHDAVFQNGDNNSAANYAGALLEARGGGGSGIDQHGHRNRATNLRGARIITIQGTAPGILQSNGSGNRATNNGHIRTEGDDTAFAGISPGIRQLGGGNHAVNTGTITTTGLGGHGIVQNDGRNFATHSGAITTTGAGTDGIQTTGDSNTVVVAGVINAARDGININGDNSTVTISAAARINAGRYGVTVSGRGNVVMVEFGAVVGGGTAAFNIAPGNTLIRPSVELIRAEMAADSAEADLASARMRLSGLQTDLGSVRMRLDNVNADLVSVQTQSDLAAAELAALRGADLGVKVAAALAAAVAERVDVNGDGVINADDFLITYYAEVHSAELGSVQNGVFVDVPDGADNRARLLGGMRGAMPPGDTGLQMLLQRANELRAAAAAP